MPVSLPSSFGQEFHRMYTDVVNCEISAPPYYTGRVPHSFFVKKRRWFQVAEWVPEIGQFQKVYDDSRSGSDTYVLGRTVAGNIEVRKNATVTPLWSQSYPVESSTITHKFFTVPCAKGTKLEDSTLTGATLTTLTDSTKSWAVNAFAGKYVYVYDSATGVTGTGVGQVAYVLSNTATALTVSGFMVIPANAKYAVFSDYGSALAWIGNGTVHIMHSDTVITQAKSFTNVLDLVYAKGRIYVVNSSNAVSVTEAGYNCLFLGNPPTIGAVNDFLNVIDFQDFILIMGRYEINHVQSETITVSGTSSTVFRLVNVSTTVGMYKKGAFTVYNQGLYLVSSQKQLQTLSITPAGVDKYVVNNQNQGIYIQKFIDNFTQSDQLSVSVVDNAIYLIKFSEVNGFKYSTVFVYDTMYLGWHRWETQVHITRYKDRFIGDTLYEFGASEFDAGNLFFDQSVKMVIGEDGKFITKRHLFSKILFGKDTTRDVRISYSVSLKSEKFSINVDMTQADYLIKLTSTGSGWPMGMNLLGTGLYGDSWSSGTAESAFIEVQTWFMYDIAIMDINAFWEERFEMWGVMNFFEEFITQVTAKENTI